MVSALLSNPKTSEPNGSRRVSLPGTSKGQPLAAFRTRCRRQAPTHGDWNRKTWGAARAAISWLRARSGPDAKLAGKSCSLTDPSSDRGRNSAQRGKGSWPRSHREKQVFQRPVEMPPLPPFLPSIIHAFIQQTFVECLLCARLCVGYRNSHPHCWSKTPRGKDQH